MPSKQEKERRKQIKAEIRENQNMEFEKSLPMGETKFKQLFDYLDNELSENGCDNTNKLTKQYLINIGQKNIDEVIKWLAKHGGYCDCEILANVEELFENIGQNKESGNSILGKETDKYQELTSRGKNEYLQALENIGWFNFSNNHKEEIKNRLNKTKENIYFASCLYDLCFDAEDFEDDEDYKYLLERIIKIMHIKEFKLDVEYLKDNNNVKIEIEIKNNVYKYYVNFDEEAGWIGVIDEYINKKILVEENINKKFLPIPSYDETIKFIYMTNEIYEKAIEIGIIPEEKKYFIKQYK
jgi:hypothetical protein